MIVLLNGCINSGKTTVAQAIVNKSKGVAHIEVDALRDFIRWMPLEESIEINFKNAVAAAKNFDEKNIHSIITYPLNVDNFHFITNLLRNSSIETYAITLFPGIDVLKTNRGSRELSEWELKRIDELHQQGLSEPNFGTIIDNSSQTVEETTDEVLKIAGMQLPKKNPLY